MGLYQNNARPVDLRQNNGPSTDDFRSARTSMVDAHMDDFRREQSRRRVEVTAAPTSLPTSVDAAIEVAAQGLREQARLKLDGDRTDLPMSRVFAKYISDNPDQAKHFVNGYGEERGFQPVGAVERERAQQAFERARDKAEILLDLHEARVPYNSRDFQKVLRSFRAANAELRSLTGEAIEEVAHTNYSNQKNRELLAEQFKKFEGGEIIDQAATRAQDKRMREVTKFELSETDSYLRTAEVTKRGDALASTARGVSLDGGRFADQHRRHKLDVANNSIVEHEQRIERDRVDRHLQHAERLAAIPGVQVRRDSLAGQLRTRAWESRVDSDIAQALPRYSTYDATGSEARYQSSVSAAREENIQFFLNSRNAPVANSLKTLDGAMRLQAEAETKLAASNAPASGTPEHTRLEQSLQRAETAIERAATTIADNDRQIQRTVNAFEQAKAQGRKYGQIDPTTHALVAETYHDPSTGIQYRQLRVLPITADQTATQPLSYDTITEQIQAQTNIRRIERKVVLDLDAARREQDKIEQQLSTPLPDDQRTILAEQKVAAEERVKSACSQYVSEQTKINEIRIALQRGEKSAGYEFYDPNYYKIKDFPIPTGTGLTLNSFRIIPKDADGAEVPTRITPTYDAAYEEFKVARAGRQYFAGAVNAFNKGGELELKKFFDEKLTEDKLAELGLDRSTVIGAVRAHAKERASPENRPRGNDEKIRQFAAYLRTQLKLDQALDKLDD